MPTKLSENTEVALPLRNIISMVAAASLATWAYFGLIERLNTLETNQTMMKSDLEQNTEFRIKWPRGEMGSLPADSKKAKRTIERNLYKDTGTVRYSCESKTVEISKGPDGKNYIVKIVE